MRKPGLFISERNLMFAIGGQLYDQAPNRQPRKADVIMNKVRDSFRKVAYLCSYDNALQELLLVERVMRNA